jgi:NitT/TauT family transport system substrate-binding protein
MVLNWKYQGPQAWFFVAQDKGYFKAEGLDVEIDQGEGSAAPITKIASGAYTAGFGDLNALIDFAAKRPAEAPVAVYMIYNTPPFTIAVKKDSPIKTPEGPRGQDHRRPGQRRRAEAVPGLRQGGQVRPRQGQHHQHGAQPARADAQDAGRWTASSATSTPSASAPSWSGIDPDKDLRFINYGRPRHGPVLQRHDVLARFAKDNPKAVQGFVKALNRAIGDVLANPEMPAWTR